MVTEPNRQSVTATFVITLLLATCFRFCDKLSSGRW